MAMEIFKLIGSIFVDSDAADKSLGKTDKKAEGVGTTLANGIKTAGKWAVGITTAAVAVGGAMVGTAKKSAATSDEIDKMSQKIGISREAYQELSYILSQNGMDVNTLQGGMKKLVNSMQDAQAGSATASKSFDALGVSVVDSSGNLRSQEDVFYDTIAALQGMENTTERNALANDLFGKSASELAPLLNSGAGSMEELRQKAHDLGLVLSDETINAGVDMTDKFDTLERTFSTLTTNLGAAFMPIIMQVADALIGFVPTIQMVLDAVAPIGNELLASIVPPLLDMANQVLPLLVNLIMSILPLISDIAGAVLPVIVDILLKIVPVATEIIQALLPVLLQLLDPILQLLDPLLQLLDPILQLILSLLDPILTLMNDLLIPLISIIADLISKAIEPLKNWWEVLFEVVGLTVKQAVDMITNSFTTIKGVFDGLINFIKNVFTGNWKGAWESVKSIFSSIWEGIKNGFKLPINYIINGINAFIKGLNKIKIPDWVPGVGGKGFSIKTIPTLASGGILERGQVGLLEGNGAEAVVPLENNRKWIHAVAQDMSGAGIGASDKIYAILCDILYQLILLAKMGIYIDKNKLIGELAPGMDKELGIIALQKARA